ncbi:NAD(P)-dependent oxidoreductase [Rhizobium leguminosarum]|uniref:NAD(P)-dependent oxidoreductase n=1 Tax=Rhizobium leguminosarum TaxID=384 RepID=UPI00143FB0E6|nr:NAD(P)-dependent oxidoreductase [Rhizobium leguminosarum]NKL21227.1 NAD-binding protein [Rhizobium leguminosarum bv. viciae]NKL56734.1 NAD-binding protein [Rhizobium leguminosarum bv. viciae]
MARVPRRHANYISKWLRVWLWITCGSAVGHPSNGSIAQREDERQMPNQKKNIAFIGLGAMGQPMAGHLLAAGFKVSGFDLSEEARSKFATNGGNACSEISTALWNADYVITMLPNGRIVRDALMKNEHWRSLKNSCLVIDMSSSAPSDTQVLSRELVAKGARLIDAPVSGGTKRAISRSLTIMAGGENSDIDDAMPVLEAMGKQIFRTGPVGSGHAMKAINNYVSGAGVVATLEGVLLAQKFGLEAEAVVEILNASSGKNNASDVKMKQFVLSGTFDSGFAAGLMAKDIRIAAELAKTLEMRLSGLNATAAIWEEAAEELGPASDHTMIAKYLKNR